MLLFPQGAPPRAPDRAASSAGVGPRKDSVRSADSLARLTSEQRALAIEIERLRTELDALRGARSSDDAPLGDDPEERLALRRELEEAHFELYDLALEDERTDAAWAPSQVARMTESFAESLPAGSTLASLECRSSLCRAELRHDSQDAQEEAIAALPQADGWSSRGSIHLVQDERGLASVFYVAREGMGLPQIE